MDGYGRLIPGLVHRSAPELRDLQRLAAQVLRGGEPTLLSSATASPASALDVTLEPRSVMIVPLIARGLVRGLITLVASTSGRRYSDDDLAMALAFWSSSAWA